MKGLLYKEICMFKPQFKSWILALAILSVYGVVLESMSILLMMPVLIGMISCLTTFTYDKSYRCEEYVAAMPLTRKNIVVCKYLFLLILDVMLTMLAGVIAAAASSLFHESLWSMTVLMMSFLGATLLLQAVVLPVIYALGPEKARFAFVIMGISPYFVLMLFKDKFAAIDVQRLLDFAWLVLPFLVAVIAVSMWVSIKIYGKKDL